MYNIGWNGFIRIEVQGKPSIPNFTLNMKTVHQCKDTADYELENISVCISRADVLNTVV